MGATKEFAASKIEGILGPARGTAGSQELAGVTAKDVRQNCLRPGSAAFLATAVGQIGKAVVITDTSATIQYVNPAFTKITG